jgi:zinc and cadmium transporter
MNPWTSTILSLLMVSGLSLLGALFLSMPRHRLDKILIYMVSFAAGGLFGDAFFELVPEAYGRFGRGPLPALLILAGLMIFFVLEKFLRWRHCHMPASRQHPHPLAFMNLVGDAVHNFIDGLLIGASYLISPVLGLTTTLAVVLHEIPHEMGNFGVLVHGGFAPKKALFWNFSTALLALAGGVTALLVGGQYAGFADALVPLTAGGFLYVAGSDLIPELHQDCFRPQSSLGQFLCMLAGMGLLALLSVLAPG